MEAQPKCNLIIDSCCDLPFEVIDRPGVQLLEFPYICLLYTSRCV